VTVPAVLAGVRAAETGGAGGSGGSALCPDSCSNAGCLVEHMRREKGGAGRAGHVTPSRAAWGGRAAGGEPEEAKHWRGTWWKRTLGAMLSLPAKSRSVSYVGRRPTLAKAWFDACESDDWRWRWAPPLTAMSGGRTGMCSRWAATGCRPGRQGRRRLRQDIHSLSLFGPKHFTTNESIFHKRFVLLDCDMWMRERVCWVCQSRGAVKPLVLCLIAR
jgi:hypothetical protein